jgi:hypothetical protein
MSDPLFHRLRRQNLVQQLPQPQESVLKSKVRIKAHNSDRQQALLKQVWVQRLALPSLHKNLLYSQQHKDRDLPSAQHLLRPHLKPVDQRWVHRLRLRLKLHLRPVLEARQLLQPLNPRLNQLLVQKLVRQLDQRQAHKQQISYNIK